MTRTQSTRSTPTAPIALLTAKRAARDAVKRAKQPSVARSWPPHGFAALTSAMNWSSSVRTCFAQSWLVRQPSIFDGMHPRAPLPDGAAIVYYLADARSPRWPRYVGSTTSPRERLRKHRRLHSSCNDALYLWKCAMAQQFFVGGEIILVVVATYPTADAARAAEWRLRQRWRRRGLCDLNTDKEGRMDAWAARGAADGWRR
jgi:predicted GIY-YIG superfamily endonuclease